VNQLNIDSYLLTIYTNHSFYIVPLERCNFTDAEFDVMLIMFPLPERLTDRTTLSC
jgi:hypothetical protein